MIPVTVAPLLDPGQARRSCEMAAGLTLDEIIHLAAPGLPEAGWDALRVTLVTPQGSAVIDRQCWRVTRPRAGVHVVIRVIPGEDAMRSVLQIVVTMAAAALGGPLAAALLPGMAATTGAALVTAGLTIVGQLAIAALIPPPKAADRDRHNRYSITGWRNQVVPDGAVPVVLGRMRYAPPFASISYTEIVGDWQYIRTLFNFGYGQLELTDFKIGDTSIADYNEVAIEVRAGLADDAPVSLYPTQVIEEAVGADLVRPLPRNDAGEAYDGPTVATPIIRTTGADASGASLIFGFPAGLIHYSKKGKAYWESVTVRIEQRLVEADEWQLVEDLRIAAKKLDTIWRQYTWQFAARGRYQIRLTMLTDETEDSRFIRRCSWVALQTLRPEYPLAFTSPLALVALRIKATHQINGALDEFTAVCSRRCLDWDHVTEGWVKRVTRNPAALFRYVLQSPANPKRVSDAGIDLEQLIVWHDFCRLNGLTYSAVLDSADAALRDILIEIAGAGRASPRHDGVRWGVTIDSATGLIVDEISPRNSSGFKARRTYIDPPHAFRVKFRDAGNDFEDAERLVRWPGYSGDITLTEVLEMPGKTDAAEVWLEGRRRQYEAIYRPDAYEVVQEGRVRQATRGDLVVLSSDVIDQVQKAARVRSVRGALIEIDDVVEMVAGAVYGIRFRVFADPEDSIGSSVVRTVRNVPGETTILTLEGEGDVPLAEDLILFGLATLESYRMIVKGVEAGTDGTSIVRLVDAAPIIDELLAADEVPAWSSRVGVEIDGSLLAPPVPRFVSVESGLAATGNADQVDYLITAGSGPVQTVQIRIDHRLTGALSWTTQTISVASGGGSLTLYSAGDAIEMRARAISPTGVPGAYTPIITLTVGADDADIPAALDDEAIVVTTLLGGATIRVATGADTATTALQIYRSTTSTLDRASDAVGSPTPVEPLHSYTLSVGDTTRSNLIAGGSMDDAGLWTSGAGWSIASGLASHAAGAAGDLTQAEAMSSGKFYRLSGRVTGRTAGSLTPALLGGTDRPGTALIGNGAWADRIQAVTGNATIALRASSTFDGGLDAVAAYLETAACLAQGTHYLWLEPQNTDGIPGPVAGPILITIV